MGKGGFSWKRAVGITKAKQKISRKTGIPLTKSGRQRKVGKVLTGGGCCLALGSSLVVLLFIIVLITSLVSGCSTTPATTPETETRPAAGSETNIDATVSPATSDGKAQSAPVPIVTQVKVTSVTDGDTIKVDLDGKVETVRLIGVDTPETVHPSKPVESYGPEASAYTKKALEGETVWLELDAQERDQHGRLLAYVWTREPESELKAEVKLHMFNAALLIDGYAQVATFPPNVKYVDYFTDFQKEAGDAEKGLWGITEQTVAPAPVPSPAPAPAPAPSENNKEVTVYVTKTGTKYHRDGCSYLAKSKIAITLSDAKAKGFEPCSKCGPPR